jgi:GTPase Era involved in 16S rRNA processing
MGKVKYTAGLKNHDKAQGGKGIKKTNREAIYQYLKEEFHEKSSRFGYWLFVISSATKAQRHEEMIMSLIKNDIHRII